MSDHFADPSSPGPPSKPPVPDGPSTQAPRPVYGPAPRRYGEPPAPTYATRREGQIAQATTAGTAPAGPPALITSTAMAPIGGYPAQPGIETSSDPRQSRGDYARWGRRAPGHLIDFVPLLLGAAALTVAYVSLLAGLVALPLDEAGTLPNLGLVITWAAVGGVLVLAGLGWTIYNRWLLGGRTGHSLGRRVMKLRLISEQTGEPIGPLNACARDLVHILDAMACVGYLWPLWDTERQTFADMLMHTVVIDERTHEGQGRAS